MNELRTLPLAGIVIDTSLQPRREGINRSYIEELKENPEGWPPITVIATANGLLLVDGFHRYQASCELGFESIVASEISYPADNDLFRIAFELNARHGRPLSLQDRKAYALKLCQRAPELSDRELGRRTGLHHSTVGYLREHGCDEPTSRIITPQRKPGDLESDVGLFDGIRFSKATKQQKAVAGYLKRLAVSLADPYEEELLGWSDDATEIARACFTSMGPQKADELLSNIEADARFALAIARERKTITKELKETS